MVGSFQSGSYASAFPDACVLKGSLATVPGESSTQVKAEFVRFVTERAAAQSPWLRVHPPEILFTGYFAEPSEIAVDEPIVRTLIEQYQTLMQKEPVVSGRQGAADIRHLNQYGHTPTVIFGAGTDRANACQQRMGLSEGLSTKTPRGSWHIRSWRGAGSRNEHGICSDSTINCGVVLFVCPMTRQESVRYTNATPAHRGSVKKIG